MNSSIIFLLFAVFLAAPYLAVDAFTVASSPFSSSTATRSSHLRMTVLSYNGKKKDFKPGTPLSKAVQQLGLKPTYSCKKYVVL
jgi:hypothetical protein